MTGVMNSSLTNKQITAWLRGLFTIAWADGHFDDEEQVLIAELTQNELASSTAENFNPTEPIEPEELAAILGHDLQLAENFLRTAVMVAIADGVYSVTEDEQLQKFCQAFGLQVEAIEALQHTLWDAETQSASAVIARDGSQPTDARLIKTQLDVLNPVRNWMDGLEIDDPRLARFLCKMIPSQCPFERDVKLFGRKVVHIPPLCKLNPLYEQLVGLRFRALSYLADDCGEDVSTYI